MSRATDIKKMLDTEAARLKLNVAKDGDSWKVTNPANDRDIDIPLRAIGRGIRNYRTAVRGLAATANPMVAATNTTATATQDELMPRDRDTWWNVENLVAAARAHGLRPYVSGGILHTPGPVDAKSYADMLHAREAEVIDYLTPAQPTAEGDHSVPKLGETARIVRPARDIAGDSKALWEILRELAAVQGEKPLSNGGTPGVMWTGALIDVIREACPDWDALHVTDVRQYLNRTEHTRCHRPKLKPPVWWVAKTWNDGGLTVTRVDDGQPLEGAEPAPKPKPKPTSPKQAAPKPAAPAATPAVETGGGALATLRAIEVRITQAEQAAAAARMELSEVKADREKMRKQRDDAWEELDELRAERDQAVAELTAINKLFGQLGGAR